MNANEKIQKVKDFRPIDDVFFEVLADDIDVCEEILKVIMEDNDLIVNDVVVQGSKRNIYGRSVRLDALCVLGSGKRVNVEVQRSDNDDHLRRVRFNSATITVKDSKVGARFEDIVDVCVIYISEFNVFKNGKTMCHIDKVIRETGETINDGATEIFVNTHENDGSLVAELMSCFLQKEINNPKFPKLSKRVKELKTTEGGASVVCAVMEKYMNEAAREASIKTAITEGINYNASKEVIVKRLVSEYEITESEAIQKYDEYAAKV